MSVAAAGAAIGSLFTAGAAGAGAAGAVDIGATAAAVGETVTVTAPAIAAGLTAGEAGATAAGLAAAGYGASTLGAASSTGLAPATASSLGITSTEAGTNPAGFLAGASDALPSSGIFGSGVSGQDLTTTSGLVGTAGQVVGGVIGAGGQQQAAAGNAQAANFNAEIAQENAQAEAQNAKLSIQAGEAQAGIQSQKNRAAVGSITANQGASGLDVDSGSPISVRSSAQDLGELDALQIRRNATLQAYGYQVQSTNDTSQGKLDTLQAGNDILAGNVNSSSTLLNTVGTAATNFAKFTESGGLGSLS